MNFYIMFRRASHELKFSRGDGEYRSYCNDRLWDSTTQDNLLEESSTDDIILSKRSSGSRLFEPYSHVKSSAEMIKYLLGKI